MRILIAPDSFKGSLTAMEVADSLEKGLKRADSTFEIDKVPVADGGEGTVKAMIAACGGRLVKKEVTGPLGDKVETFFGILDDKRTAVIEMAAASGLPLVPPHKRNPLKTTTYGTGELIRAALDEGCCNFIIGIGGSATNDCGIGMAQALGIKFLDEEGKEVGFKGQDLIKIRKIDMSAMDERILMSKILVACDVDNPLYGKRGAAYVYGPQKGATPQMVEELDKGLINIANIIKRDLEIEVNDLPGAGAAGGMGAGFVAFFGAELRSGVEIVLNTIGLEEKVRSADLVITGEGKMDLQTINGKTPVGVAKIAKKYSLPVIGVAGSLGEGAEKLYQYGIDVLFSIIDTPMPLEEAMEKASVLLEKLGENIGRMIKI